ncbi:hypothetical protein PsorP6_006687 [Peronosclerospora sorghi]|uniref:Uncharacterized protein n=1 Tax=Peronosclerospora sorghi TaxID=230839 RepID=A0ACC0W5F8_9STRA|nr:hypothetical protein PsorP6_006687 [Peronosclerospora sorghi]
MRSFSQTGCSNLTDKGIKYTANLPRLKKLYCGGCRRVTDGAFDAPFKALKKLDATNCRLTDKAMEHIGRLRSLNSLVIRGCQQISDNATRLLSGLTKMKYFDARHCSRIHSIPTEWTQLQVLLLGYTAFAEADTAVLQQLMELQELELRRCRIMKRLFRGRKKGKNLARVTPFTSMLGFQFISRLHNLERLDLGETPLTDSGLLEICDSVRKLKALNISNTEVSDTGTHGLAKLKELRILHMDTQGVTSNALMNVACLVHLEKLDLFGANITDNGLLHLVQLHHLQELTICGGKISDRGVGIISKLTSLTILNLSQNGYVRPMYDVVRSRHDVVVLYCRNIRTKSLFYLRSLTGLRSLNLSDTGISALSLRHLSPLKELQSLSVYGCSLSQKHIDLLRGTRKDRFWILGTEFKVLVSFLRALFSKPAGAQMLAVYLML